MEETKFEQFFPWIPHGLPTSPWNYLGSKNCKIQINNPNVWTSQEKESVGTHSEPASSGLVPLCPLSTLKWCSANGSLNRHKSKVAPTCNWLDFKSADAFPEKHTFSFQKLRGLLTCQPLKPQKTTEEMMPVFQA